MPQPTHDTVSSLSTQLNTLVEHIWEQEVLSRLPADDAQQARILGAFVRVRKLASPAVLLRGLLAFVLCVSSFRQLGAWAVLVQLADVSHVAWHRHLQRARGWLLWLLCQQLAVPAPACSLAVNRVVLVDATRLKQPGGCGDDWRVHLGYELTRGSLLHVRVSDRHTAEGLALFVWQPGDLIVADRGYSRASQLAYARQQEAHVLVRLAVQQVPLLDEAGNRLEVYGWLRTLTQQQASQPVTFQHAGQTYGCRLIACALPEEAAERARAKERKRAAKQQRELKADTLFGCGWLLLLCSLPAEQWSDEQVRTLYRARWQIELVIKRMKQVLKLAQLRGKSALTNEATILALLLAWSLLQGPLREVREALTSICEQWALAHQSGGQPAAPEATNPPVVSSWSVTALCVQTLRQQVSGIWTQDRLNACLPALRRFLTGRRRRSHQERTIRHTLLTRLAAGSNLLFSCSSA